MKFDIIRAWKDEAYRNSLSAEQRALLPANPIGELELSDLDLEMVQGGLLDSILGECISVRGNCNSLWGNCASSYSNGSCNFKWNKS